MKYRKHAIEMQVSLHYAVHGHDGKFLHSGFRSMRQAKDFIDRYLNDADPFNQQLHDQLIARRYFCSHSGDVQEYVSPNDDEVIVIDRNGVVVFRSDLD